MTLVDVVISLTYGVQAMGYAYLLAAAGVSVADWNAAVHGLALSFALVTSGAAGRAIIKGWF
jgi:hypothetical protein